MVELGILHYLYIVVVIVILAAMFLKKDIVMPCMIGVMLIGLVTTRSVIESIQVVYRALVVSGTELLDIILIIGLVVAMSESLKAAGADELMVKPMKKLMVGPRVTFVLLSVMMLVVAWVLWPSPAVALLGAIVVPAAIGAGLPAIWVAVAINLCGHGMALSSDFFIQGAPSITASAAGIESGEITTAMIPLWLTMSVVTLGAAFLMMQKEIKESPVVVTESKKISPAREDGKAKIIAILTPLAFVGVFIAMVKSNIKGSDATALVGGSIALIAVCVTLSVHGVSKGCNELGAYIKKGLAFGMKIFGPVIVIGAFFFIGNKETAELVLGEGATGILADIGNYISQQIPISPILVATGQAVVGGITGLDGSGFSGLPLVGSLAQTFGGEHFSPNILGALGQITAIWVGGGTIIPWGGIVAAAAVCGVSPVELARKNLKPVLLGFTATTIMAVLMNAVVMAR